MLRPHQEAALDHLRSGADSLLFIEMGMGKTLIVLTRIAELLKEDPTRRFLIVAPLRVNRYVWQQERDKWDHTRHLTISDVSDFPKEERKAAALDPHTNIILVNYEKLTWLCEAVGLPFYGLVMDEVDKMKDPGTKRFRAIRYLTHKVSMRIGMTGTPASESLLHLWGPVFLITNQMVAGTLVGALGHSVTAYRAKYFYEGRWTYTAKPDTLEKVTDLIRPFTFTATADSGEPEYRDVYYGLGNEGWDIYDEMKRDFAVELRKGVVTAAHAADMVNKLRQIATGFIYTEDGTRWLHDGLVDAYDTVRRQIGNHVVVYNFQAERERFAFPHLLSSKLTPAAERRVIDQWNAGKIPQLALHPAAGGHGLNLQDSGSNNMVFLSLPWSRGMYDQTVARLHRMGQTKRVVVWRLLARDTVDTAVLSALEAKKAGQDAVYAALSKNSVKSTGNKIMDAALASILEGV